MAIVLVRPTILVNVILDGLVLIAQLTVDVITILPVIIDLVYVISVKIGPLDNFVNIASKCIKVKINYYISLFAILIVELEVMVMRHHLKDVISVIAMTMEMNN